MSRVRVVVVDDSALMRQLLTALLNASPHIEVVGTAPDPYAAREMIKTLNPDVVTLDVEMPKMDGLAFLEKIMTLRPMPVLMVSSLTQEGEEATLRALELGAVDFVAKPLLDLKAGMQALQEELIDKVLAAARARVRPLDHAALAAMETRPRLTGGASLRASERVVAIGASTGGVEALREVVTAMPADAPAIIITQHMPEQFTASFARRLDGLSAMTVKEASDNERVLPGHVYIAPGNRHLELDRSGANFVCRLHDGPLVSGHRPSVDVLFQSVARHAGANAIGVILTGMGKDGADGMLAMRRAGAHTIGEDEASCVVYGMPKVAMQIGAVAQELPLGKIAAAVLDQCRASGRQMRI